MKSICGLVFALLLAAAHAGENATLDFEFQQAAREGKVSVQEMLRRFRIVELRLTEPDISDSDSVYFTEIYALATRKAIGAEETELEKMLLAMPTDASEFDECFSAYATSKIRRRVAELAIKPAPLEWTPTTEPMPKELANAPAPFRDAWKLYHTVLAPYLAIVEPPEEANPPKKTPALEADLRKLVGKPEPGVWKDLAEHTWEVWCGTGSEILYHPRNRALLLSFLADGKLREAAGAALAQVASSTSFSHGDPMDSVSIDLLTALGLDWEQVKFGSLLPSPGVFQGNDAWRLLMDRGSERAIRQCFDLIRWAKVEPWNTGEFLSLALGPDPQRVAIPVDSSGTPLFRTLALPPEIRHDFIAMFADYLAPTNSPAGLIRAMDGVPSHCVKDLREPLTALLAHHAHPVAVKALQMLKAAKLTTGQEKITPAPPPLRFRLLLNGKPFVGEKVFMRADLSPKERAANPNISWFAPSENLIPDANGEISYSLEEALEPERIGLVKLRAAPVSSIDDIFSPKQAPPKQNKDWPGPWFDRQIEARAGDEPVHDVELRAADIEVKLTTFDKMTPESPIEILLWRGWSRQPVAMEGDIAKVTTSLADGAFFRRLQPGKYTLAVKAPGAARYESKELTLGDASIVHEVKLEPGRNVRGTAVLPDGQKLSLVTAGRLFRDGVEVPSENSEEWQGLAFGKYTARIASTREYEEEARKAGAPMSRIALEDRTNSVSVSFVIDASTPATLDLGEIVVPRERR